MGGFEDDALLGDVFGDLDLELEARFAELEARADLADAQVRADADGKAGPPPPRPADAPPAAAPSADDPLRDLKSAFTASSSAKPEADATAAPRELLIVLCPSPSCGRKNRLDRARAVDPASTPRCGACGTSLVTRQ